MRWRTKRLVDILNRMDGDVRVGAEIGVAFGSNAIGVLVSFPELHLYLVDGYVESYLFNVAGGSKNSKYTNKQARVAAERLLARFGDRTSWIVKPSLEAVQGIKDHSLCFAFIDADHSYEAVKRDIEVWLPKIRPGGILAGHDYSRKVPGVPKAVNERFGDKRNRWGDIWWVNINEIREAT